MNLDSFCLYSSESLFFFSLYGNDYKSVTQHYVNAFCEKASQRLSCASIFLTLMATNNFKKEDYPKNSFKITVMGSVGSGKTSLCTQMTSNYFSDVMTVSNNGHCACVSNPAVFRQAQTQPHMSQHAHTIMHRERVTTH